MEIETLAWLRTTEGGRLLDDASRAWTDHPGDPVRVASVVRRLEPDAEKAAAATTQAQLRAKAATKFGDAAGLMFFTPDALEQATRTRVADHRAARLAAAIPGAASSTWAAGSVATCWPSPGPGSSLPASTRTRCGWRWPRPTSPRWGSPAP